MKKTFPFLIFGFLLFPFLSSAAPTFFTVEWKNGKAWLQNPSQKPFLSLGVNHVGDHSYRAPDENYYNPVKNQFGGNQEAWVKSALARLRTWNFNTIGSWSDEALFGRKFPYTVMLYIGKGNPPHESALESLFKPDFEQRVRENTQRAAKYKDDPYLMGYFLDNEMAWDGAQGSWLEKYAAYPIENTDKAALKKFLKGRYQDDISRFNETWQTSLSSFDAFDGPVTLQTRSKKQKADAAAWMSVMAERYFEVTTRILRELDPNHLILGTRFIGMPPWNVAEICGKYCDVVTVNHYQKSGDINRIFLDNLYAKSQKPILITEYSYSSPENQSGDPNTAGADVSVPTQKERVEHFNRYARQLLDLPYIVGFHWFEWADQPPKGRFDGENCNYGLVDIHDKPYALLTQAHAKLNRSAVTLHAKSKIPLPEAFKEPVPPDFRRAEPKTKVPEVRPYLKIDSTAKAYSWGDAGQNGKMNVDFSTGTVEINFQSGTGWGCGASFPSNVGPLAGESAADCLGYSFFQFKAFTPKDLKFTIFIAEAGSGDPSQGTYKGANGADGESWSFPFFTGTGRWETYRVDLADLERRTVWGNQNGNNILDLQGLGDVEFYVSGSQGAGKLLVKDLEFKAK